MHVYMYVHVHVAKVWSETSYRECEVKLATSISFLVCGDARDTGWTPGEAVFLTLQLLPVCFEMKFEIVLVWLAECVVPVHTCNNYMCMACMMVT